MHTFKSILDQLGKDAQVTGGCILVREGIGNIEIGRNDPSTGTFVLSAKGAAYLKSLGASDSAPVVAEEAPAPKSKAKAKAKPEATIEDLELD